MYLSQVDFLKHILDECNYLLLEYKDNTFDDFVNNQRLAKAICRSLEIIGEAAGRIHPDLKAKYNLVPWRQMSDIRNKIIHDYFGIDYDIVWDTVKTDIPELKQWIEIIIAKESA
jgi:uncharacterized protein with HEPN domain